MSVQSIWDYFFADPLTELYKFQCGSKLYAYAATSKQSIRFDNLVYQPEYVWRSGLRFSSDYAKDTLSVTLPATTGVANLFLGGTPEHLLKLTIYRGGKHAADFAPIWVGVVNGASFDFTGDAYSCELACETVASRMERFGLVRCYQLTCPHTLYGARCGVNQVSFASVRNVIESSGFTVIVDGPVMANGYYAAGQLVKRDGGRRFIAASTANTLTMERPITLDIGEWLTIYPGCDKARTTCINKFSNGINYGGFPWMPLTSPFTSTIG